MKKNIKLKKITAAFLAVATLASCTQETSDSQTNAPQDTSTPSSSEQVAAPLSNPVAVDENGEVDMEVALSYETDIDAFLKAMDEKTVAEGDTVSDNTNEKTKKVFDYLRENYGKNLITAQQMSDSKQIEDVLYYMETDDLPAMKGFDFIFVTTSEPDKRSEWTDMAIDWHTKSGGLVYFCWHWNANL